MTVRPLLPLLSLLLPALLAAGDAAAPAVGVLWSTKSSMADRVYAGFAQVMAAKAPQVQVEYKPALKDDATAASLYDEWQARKQAIVFLRSSGAKIMAEKPPKVPCFIGAANNPVELGLMKDMAKPDGMVTGVTYYVPYKHHLDAFRSIWPDLKKVGVVLQDGHPSAPIEEKGVTEAAAGMGIEAVFQKCKTKNDVAIATKALVDAGVQVIAVGNQALIFDNAATVAQNAGKVPVMSFADKPIAAKQVIGGLGVDDFLLGQKLAESVIAVVVDKKPVAEVPVVVDPAPKLRLVMDKVKAAGIQVPQAVLDQAVKVE